MDHTYHDRNFLIIVALTRLDDTGSHIKVESSARPKNQYEKERKARLLYKHV
jgi:hypothetical protein